MRLDYAAEPGGLIALASSGLNVAIGCSALVAAVGICLFACGGGFGFLNDDRRPNDPAAPAAKAFEPPTAKARAGRAPGAKPGAPQLDDPDRPNYDPSELDADPAGEHLAVNPFKEREVVSLRAQRYDPFILLAPRDEDLSAWEAPRNDASRDGLQDFEFGRGMIRLAPGTRVIVEGATALGVLVEVAPGQPDAGRTGYVLPGCAGYAEHLVEWRRRNSK